MNLDEAIRVLVVDDEPIARQGLISMLEAVPSVYRLRIIGEAKDGIEALGMINQLKPDVVFLDIQMPGLDGFEVVELVNGAAHEIVFVTAFDEFAIRAFEHRALDYLLKPFSSSRLIDSIDRLAKRLHERAQMKTESLPRAASSFPDKFLAKRGKSVCVVTVDNLIAVESAANYVYLHTKTESPILRASLSDFYQKLDPAVFIRTHRSWVVKMNAITSMKKLGGGDVRLTLSDNTELPLSRRFRTAFEEKMGRIP